MPVNLVIFAVSLFAFIVSMIGALGHYFAKQWKWFLFMLFCVVVSAACMAVELYQWESPAPPHEMPLVIRSPATPL
jgi:glucan phosphoethanolaminetransferase (alkaline phosphatase superfamily)